LVPDQHDAVDIFGGPLEQSGFEHAVWYGGGFLAVGGGRFEVEEGEVDVAVEVGREPGFEGEGFCCEKG